MRNILDSYIARKTAASVDAYHPINILDLTKYTFVVGYFDTEEKNSYVSRVFETFVDCHVTSTGTYDDHPGVMITRIKDEKGAFISRPVIDNTVPYGVFVRNNLPMWILQIIGNLASILCYTFDNTGDKITIPIETTEHFESWLGEDPHPFAFADDIVFASFDKTEFKEKLRVLVPFWDLPEHVLVPLRISGIDKENIQLMPVADLSRVISYSYDVDMKTFRQCVLNNDVNLFSVTISTK